MGRAREPHGRLRAHSRHAHSVGEERENTLSDTAFPMLGAEVRLLLHARVSCPHFPTIRLQHILQARRVSAVCACTYSRRSMALCRVPSYAASPEAVAACGV